jgi:glycosyltransferase involved in cell wall biosynthesis
VSEDGRLGVAQVIVRLGRGGAERMLVTLANGLDPARFDVHVITIRDAGELAGDLAPHVSLHALERGSAWDLASFFRFRRVLARHGIEIVETHSHLSAYFVRIARVLGARHIRHVVHEHFPLIEQSRLRFLDRLCLSRVDYCFAASAALADYASRWIGIPRERCEVLTNATDVTSPPAAERAPVFTIAQLGRVTPQKNQRMALAVAERLRLDGLPFRWLLIGSLDSAYADSCRAAATTLGLEEVISFSGERADTQAILGEAHVGVLTSVAEAALPLALLEYMAAALPVVVTDTGESGTFVRESGGGRVVAQGDLEAFAAALSAYAADREAAERAGAANRRYVEAHHRVESVVERVASVYEALAAGGQGSTARTGESRRVRVLFLVSSLESGIGVSLLRTLRYLPERYEPVVCEFMSEGSANKDLARRLGVRVIELRKRGVDPTIVPDLIRVARDVRPQVVQGSELETNFYACLLGRLVRARVVASFHGMVTAFRPSKLPFLLLILQCATRTVCVSTPIARRCRARMPWTARRISVIPNGVENSFRARRRPARSAGPMTVSYVANFHSNVKGHEYLLRAFRLLGRDEARLWLIGAGSLLADMRRLADELDLDEQVTFWGFQPDVLPLLEKSDVFVLPSLSEGCPHALLEAMATGLPVVATRVDGVREIVADRRNGLLVPPRSPEAIRDAIRELARDEGLRAALGASAARRIEESYRAGTVAQQYEQLYADLAASS